MTGGSEGPIGRAHTLARYRQRALEFAAVFVIYYIAGRLGQAAAHIRSSDIGPVWPAYGVALAAVIICGARIWPAVLAAAFVVSLQSPEHPEPVLTAFCHGAGGTLGALTGGALLRRLGFDRSLSRLKDALALIVLGAGISAMISAAIGVCVLYATGIHGYSGIGRAFVVYWMGDGTGVLLVTPLALAAPGLSRRLEPEQSAEFAGLMLILLGACFLIFGDTVQVPGRHVLAFAVLPFIMWAAIRVGTIGVAVSTLFVATFATVATALGHGPFAQNGTFVDAILLDVFFAVITITGLLLASVIAERERAEAEHERLMVEQASLEARLRLAAIVESSDDAIVREDAGGAITDWNGGAERLYGYTADEAIGQNFFALVQPDFAGAGGLAPDTMTKYETIHRKKDGTRFAASVTISPIRDAAGHLIGESAIARDMTERLRAQALHEEVAHLGRVSLVSALTGALAHEINQPLTAVAVNADAAAMLLAREQPPLQELRDVLRDIASDNKRAGEVLQRVRTLLRKETTQFGPVDLGQTIADVVRLVRSSADRRGIRIAAMPQRVRPVRGDRVQVQQVLLNLLVNACDAVADHLPERRRIQLRAEGDEGGGVIHVDDLGSGLTDSELERIFDPFYTTKREGLGLGLSICRAIVAVHGGSLEAARNPQGGMTFSVRLPYWVAVAVTEDVQARDTG